MSTKAGYAAIIGKPNAGKSTIINKLLGTKISIVTRKPQTTRKRVVGIFSSDDSQIVFLDNPGILDPKYEMQNMMMQYVSDSMDEADVILLIVDSRTYSGINDFFNLDFINNLKLIEKPKILILNKIDLLKDVKLVLPIIKDFADLNIFDEIVPVSALKQNDFNDLIITIEKYIPESEFYFDPELISSQTERFFVSEIIREKIFLSFSEEVPYACEVFIQEFKERSAGKWYISADIIIERQTQKGILIGDGGNKIREIGERSRIEIENYLEMPIFLELFVKVKEKWRKDRTQLRSFGY